MSSAAPSRAVLRALVAAAMLFAVVPPSRASESERADFDARPDAGATAHPPGARARTELRGRLGRFGTLSLDRRTGTLRSIGRLDGFLTGPSGRDGADIALAYAREHAEAFGLAGGDLDGLRLVDRQFVDGVEHLGWEQRYRGIPAADAGLQAAVTGSGRLLNVTGPPAANLSVGSIVPTVSAEDAYAAARASGGDPSPDAAVAHRDGGAERATRFADGGRASLSLYRSGTGYRLAWRVLAPVSSTGVYDVLVDARSGAAVRRGNRVKFAVPARVFESDPDTAAQVTKPDISSWLTPGLNRLEGPNAYAFLDVNDKVGPQDSGYVLTPQAGSDVAPVGGGYQFPLTLADDVPGDGCPDDETEPFPTSACTWNPQQLNSWLANKQQSATQLFYLVNTFHDHLRNAAGIGFVDGEFRSTAGQARGNPNTGASPTASDPVLAQTLDGANTATGRPDEEHVNNANFLALPDGYPGFLQVYLWKPPFGGYDGANDASMVFHEYTHGLSGRLVTDAAGYAALDSPQAGAMSEGWSDFYALDYLVAKGLLTDDEGVADVRLGSYLDNAGTTGRVRVQSIDCVAQGASTGCPNAPGLAGAGAFTYGDFGKITPAGAEVHYDGEIWAQTLWALRTALIGAHGEAEGVTLARQYITQAMRLSPPEPSFLEMRNAILEASPPEDDLLLWSVFAQRGMGYFAATDGGDDIAPVADFVDPDDLQGVATISGTVRDEELHPVAGATVGVAGFDAGLGPQLSAQTGVDGKYAFDVLTIAAGTSTYPAVRARKAAYLGDREELVGVQNGEETTRNFELERDWSSGVPGAGTARVLRYTGTDNTENGCGPGGLIDDEPGVVWSTDKVAGGRSIVVDLGAPIDVARILIDPAAGCGDDASAALGSYQLLGATGPDDTPFTLPSATTPAGTFEETDNGTLSTAFSGMAPRVRFVTLRAIAPQDPSAGGSGASFIDVAELHVARQPNTPLGPATETTVATSIGTTSARLTGAVTPHDGAADVVFQYGTTTAYGATVSAGTLPAGGTTKAVAATAGGLAPATTYHFRAVARRGGHDYRGADRTFRTAALPPPPTPTPTPTPAPTTPTKLESSRLTASRKGVFKVALRFGNRAPAGEARLSVYARRKRIAVATLLVQAGSARKKTLKLTSSGRRMIKPGASRKVTVELRLPGGAKVKRTVRLTRKRR